jgi:RNA polymerase sigma factor (sigma-70 family)
MPTDQEELPGTDQILISFLNESDGDEADRKLAALINTHAGPLIRSIIASTVRSSSRSGTGQAADLDDIYGEATMKLIIGLRRLRSGKPTNAIGNFRNYVAVTAYNCCYGYLRRKHPARTRLKDRIQYVLRHQKGFDLWEGQLGGWECGYVVWRDHGRRIDQRRVERLTDNPTLYAKPAMTRPREDLPDLVKKVFDAAGGPLGLDELVSIVADISGISDGEIQLNEETGHSYCWESIGADSKPQEAALEWRVDLTTLWKEIRQLPSRQRTALLLGLDDRHGRDAITLLTNARVASLRHIAEALEIGVQELAAMSHDLPLDDASIASRLGSTRQQVSNLRKAARERLARRIGSRGVGRGSAE